MTSSIREQILEALFIKVENAANCGGRVYRERIEPLSREETPSLTLEPVEDQRAEATIARDQWTMKAKFVINTRGDVPSQIADSVVVDIHNKITADRTLGGLTSDIRPTEVQFLRYEADQPAGLTECTYEIVYQVSVADLTSNV